MKKKSRKKAKKKIIKKIKTKSYGRKKSNGGGIDLQKVVDFKFQTIAKIYKNFSKKREKEKGKQEKLKEKDREKQIKKQQKHLNTRARQSNNSDPRNKKKTPALPPFPSPPFDSLHPRGAVYKFQCVSPPLRW